MKKRSQRCSPNLRSSRARKAKESTPLNSSTDTKKGSTTARGSIAPSQGRVSMITRASDFDNKTQRSSRANMKTTPVVSAIRSTDKENTDRSVAKKANMSETSAAGRKSTSKRTTRQNSRNKALQLSPLDRSAEGIPEPLLTFAKPTPIDR